LEERHALGVTEVELVGAGLLDGTSVEVEEVFGRPALLFRRAEREGTGGELVSSDDGIG